MSERHPVLSCHHLRKSFKDGLRTIDVLTDVNLVIQPGECVAILGASGSGKSTLLHLLGGLDQPDSGDVFVSGHQLTKISEKKLCELRNRYLGFAYQFHHLLPEFNALENVAMPLLVRGCKPAEAKQAANEILNAVGLAERTTHKIAQLSGGERQRTAIARALVTKPSCVLADEPTGNLDHNTAEKVFELMLELNQQLKTSFLIVTHDLNLAKRLHRTLTLEDGVLCE